MLQLADIKIVIDYVYIIYQFKLSITRASNVDNI